MTGRKCPGLQAPRAEGRGKGRSERRGEGAWASPAPPGGLNPSCRKRKPGAFEGEGRHPWGGGIS